MTARLCPCGAELKPHEHPDPNCLAAAERLKTTAGCISIADLLPSRPLRYPDMGREPCPVRLHLRAGVVACSEPFGHNCAHSFETQPAPEKIAEPSRVAAAVVSDGWRVWTTTNEFGQRGAAVGVFADESVARARAETAGWYGSNGEVEKVTCVRLGMSWYVLDSRSPVNLEGT